MDKDSMTYSKKKFAADAHYVTSILNWILAVILCFGISVAFDQESEAMARGLFPVITLLFFCRWS